MLSPSGLAAAGSELDRINKNSTNQRELDVFDGLDGWCFLAGHPTSRVHSAPNLMGESVDPSTFKSNLIRHYSRHVRKFMPMLLLVLVHR